MLSFLDATGCSCLGAVASYAYLLRHFEEVLLACGKKKTNSCEISKSGIKGIPRTCPHESNDAL